MKAGDVVKKLNTGTLYRVIRPVPGGCYAQALPSEHTRPDRREVMLPSENLELVRSV
jgi:hypothetical protein